MDKKEKINEKLIGIGLGALASMIAYIPMLILTGVILNFILFEVLNNPSNTNIDDYLSIYHFWIPTLFLGVLGGFLVTLLPANRSGEKSIPLRASLVGVLAAIVATSWMNWMIFTGWIESERTSVILHPSNNVATVQAIPIMPGYYQEVLDVKGNIDAFEVSKDGKLLAYSVDNVIFIYNIETDTLQGNPLFGHSQKISDVAFSSDGRWLASASDDQRIIIWSIDSNQPIIQLSGHETNPIYVSINPDNKTVASGDSQGAVILWDIDSGQEIERFHTDSSKLLCLQFSPDGKYLAVCTDYPDGIELWNMEGHESVSWLTTNNEWNGTIHGLDFSPNSQLIAGAALFGPFFWNVTKQYPVGAVQEILTGNTVDFSPDGKRIVSTSNGGIYLWKVSSRKPIGKLENRAASRTEASFLSNDKILAINWDRYSADKYPVTTEIGIWDLEIP